MPSFEPIRKQLSRFEPYLFWLASLCMLLPIFLNPAVYTYDGPAHMYNARQLWEMLINQNSWLKQFYVLNPNPDNWFVHGQLMLLQGLLGSVLAEKVWLAAYVLIFITGFRRWMLHMQQRALSWWVFLFPYFFNLLMGQYSFALSVALLPYFLLQWQQYLSMPTKKSLFWTAFWLLLLYLTHVVSFGVAGLVAGMLLLFSDTDWHQKTNKLLKLALAALPGLLLSFWFMQNNAQEGTMHWLSWSERLQYLLDGRSLIVYSYSEDVGWTRLLMGIFSLLLLIGIWKNRQNRLNDWVWLIIWSVLLLLYLLAPDQAAGGGYIQTRLLLLWLLLGVSLLASLKHMKLWYAWSMPLVLFITIRLGAIHEQTYRQLAHYQEEWQQLAAVLPAEKTSVTFNFSPLWIQHHIHLIVGHDKAFVHSANYEADNAYFPLRWKADEGLYSWLNHWRANKHLMPCTTTASFQKEHLPDFIISYFEDYGRMQACTSVLDTLRVNYNNNNFFYKGEKVIVYQLDKK